MTEEFDPYSQWLDIAPHEHPVDHYRLLGVTRFETDVVRISAAADQRMAHIRTFQTGPRGPYTQQLLNELAAARVCLLNNKAKSAYDQMLEGALLAAAEPPRHHFETPPDLPSSDSVDGPATTSSTDRRWIIAFSLVLLIGVGTIALLARYRADDDFANAIGELTTFELTGEPRPEPPEVEREPVLIYQEADGGVNFPATVAQLHGPNVRLALMNDVDVITDWNSMDDWVSWNFKVVKLPPQGIFRVRVTYAAQPESDGGSFVISVGEKEKECEIRGTGEPVTDEYYLAVPRNGDHILKVRPKSKPSEKLMTLKSLTFISQ